MVTTAFDPSIDDDFPAIASSLVGHHIGPALYRLCRFLGETSLKYLAASRMLTVN